MKFLNVYMLLEFLVSFGTVCHNELSRNTAICMPYDTVLTLGKSNRLFTLKLHDVFFCIKIVFMKQGLRPEFVLWIFIISC